MDEEIAITKVRQKLMLIQDQLDIAKRRVLALEGEAKKLMTTLEVLENLGEETISGIAVYDDGRTTNTATARDYVTLAELINAAGDGRTTGQVLGSRMLGSLLNPTTRQLIVAQFVRGESLTKIQVVERVKAKDSNVNEGTVATTLSKLTAEGILEKAEGNAYRLKVVPGAENTGDTDDLLKT
ncbi:hypothetical protein [Caballeronia mineralivorans]|jgi:hypothetical protein|uniref:hypothetical protein n=1 Tax=Caballeronia mineralivorans TaxID=2010198 RepID=UPI0023F24C0B|nr:hypothetical protein [Caballeronia mineralivorans]MDB5781872.1 hypothetical protein [Caballeronia mineralivorans]